MSPLNCDITRADNIIEIPIYHDDTPN